MTFHVERKQHPVGHGFFHSAALRTEDGSAFRYVYDCGALRGSAGALSAAVADYRSTWRATQPLNLLCISHLHQDHVNGVPSLLHKRMVDTIMLPMLTSGERIVAFARATVGRGHFWTGDFLRDVLVDPIQALSRFDPGQILLVRRNAARKGAPTGRDLATVRLPLTDRSAVRGPTGPGRLRCEVVGEGPTPTPRQLRRVDRFSQGAAVMPDSLALRVDAGSDVPPWLLATYAAPDVVGLRDEFLGILRRRLGWPYDGLRLDALVGPLLYDYRLWRILVDTYERFGRDLNVTSLCMYSGPAHPAPERRAIPEVTLDARRGAGMAGGDRGIGWLGTGDAPLGSERRVRDLVRHYAGHLGMVGTMTLPHHGSDKDVCEALLEAVGPTRCVVSASARSERHPGPETRRLLGERNVTLSVVTEEPGSVVVEEFDRRTRSARRAA